MYERLATLLATIRKTGLTLNPKKTKICVQELDLLGFHITPGAVTPQQSKVDAIANFPRPHNKRTVRAFLGVATFHRKLIPSYASIASPLTDLTKEVPWSWGEKQEQAFQYLKQVLSTSPIIQLPNFQLQFILTTKRTLKINPINRPQLGLIRQ